MVTPADRNAKRKQAEKKLKHKSSRTRDTMNVDYKVYDHTDNNWSHRNSNEVLRKNAEAVPGKHSIDSLQKTAILGHHT